jgi:hypothetical protein
VNDFSDANPTRQRQVRLTRAQRRDAAAYVQRRLSAQAAAEVLEALGLQ